MCFLQKCCTRIFWKASMCICAFFLGRNEALNWVLHGIQDPQNSYLVWVKQLPSKCQAATLMVSFFTGMVISEPLFHSLRLVQPFPTHRRHRGLLAKTKAVSGRVDLNSIAPGTPPLGALLLPDPLQAAHLQAGGKNSPLCARGGIFHCICMFWNVYPLFHVQLLSLLPFICKKVILVKMWH